MLQHCWNYLPLLSSVVQSGLGMLMTVWPKMIWELEESKTFRIRVFGFILAAVGVCGAISGFQQDMKRQDLEAKLATKEDIRYLGNVIEKSKHTSSNNVRKKEILLFINNHPISDPAGNVIPVESDLKNEDIILCVHNDTRKTLFNIKLLFEIHNNCTVRSPSPLWQQVSESPNNGGLQFTMPIEEYMNPGLPVNLPSIKLSCDNISTLIQGVIAITAKDIGPLKYGFAIIPLVKQNGR